MILRSAKATRSSRFCFLAILLVSSVRGADLSQADSGISRAPTNRHPRCVRDRLWIWGHPAGVYNGSYLAPLGRKSTIEPVAAADWMGIRNMIFVRYQGKPRPPFETYYEPFKKLDRVY